MSSHLLRPILRPIFLAAALLGLLFGCGGGEQRAYADEAEVLAKVNNSPITRSQIEALRAAKGDESEASERDLLSELISLRIVSLQAEKERLAQDPKIAAQLDYIRERTLVSAYLERLQAEMAFTEEELQALYRQQFADLMEYKARHILYKTREEAETAIGKLDEGADFATLAKDESIGPSASRGGDLGWFSAKTMVPAFAEAVSEMTPGHYSEAPLQTRFGWHVILLEQTRESTPPDFAEIEPRLRTFLVNQRLQDRILKLQQAARIEMITSPEADSESASPSEPRADSGAAAD